MSGVIDKAVAARVASKLASAGSLERSYLMDGLDQSFEALVAQAEPLIAHESGFQPEHPAISRVLSRSEWAKENVESMLELMAPLITKIEKRVDSNPSRSSARQAYSAGMGAQLGAVLGFLSTRVLGQYDVLMSHQNQVWFVGSNIVLTERRLGFNPRDFRLWVVLHELTHRGQFEGNPWVRPYFRGLIDDLIEALQVDPKTLLDRMTEILKRSGRDRGEAAPRPAALRLLKPEQRVLFDQVQAFMSVIEGHGNFVMDRIGAVHIPSQPRMSRALRSQGGGMQSPLARLMGRVLGFELKKAQYEQGQHFFETIFEAGGSPAVRSCFASAEALPTLAEVRAPETWLERMTP